MSSKYSTISFKCGTTTSLASFSETCRWTHCQHGFAHAGKLGELFEVWPNKFPSSPNIKCVRMRQALGEKASINGQWSQSTACSRQNCKWGSMSSNLQDMNSARLPQDVFLQWHGSCLYQHLPVKDIWRSLKIEANGYSPCQTILYSIESFWILWWLGDPPWLRKRILIKWFWSSPLNENVQVWLHHWEVSVEYLQQWDIPVPWDGIFTTPRGPLGKSTVSPSMGLMQRLFSIGLPASAETSTPESHFWTNVSHQK